MFNVYRHKLATLFLARKHILGKHGHCLPRWPDTDPAQQSHARRWFHDVLQLRSFAPTAIDSYPELVFAIGSHPKHVFSIGSYQKHLATIIHILSIKHMFAIDSYPNHMCAILLIYKLAINSYPKHMPAINSYPKSMLN